MLSTVFQTFDYADLIIKSIEEKGHPALLKLTGGLIDMDKIPAQVKAAMPDWGFTENFLFFAACTTFWVTTFFACRALTPFILSLLEYVIPNASKIYAKKSRHEQLEFVQILNCQLHLILVIPLYVYGLVYADAKKGTSWFNDDEYRVTAYPFQALLMLFSTGYFAGDAIAMGLTFDKKPMDLYMHHVFVGGGTLLSVYCGGLVFTLNFLNFLVEISSVTLNIRVLLQYFNMKDSQMFAIVGLVFMAQFFWLRIVLMLYVNLTKMYCEEFGAWPGFSCYSFVGEDPTKRALGWIIRMCYLIYSVL